MIASFLMLIHPYKMPALQASFLYEYVYVYHALKAVNTGGEKRNKKRLCKK